ncbi:hypothetical protein [Streptomyces lavendulae]|uniref:hypothetical protein n=1 Tax=Streptomyces lavendulae TaxID=1914 RepID=UPI0031F09190
MPWTVTTTSETTEAPTDSATVETAGDLHQLIKLLVADPRQLSIHVRPAARSEA